MTRREPPLWASAQPSVTVSRLEASLCLSSKWGTRVKGKTDLRSLGMGWKGLFKRWNLGEDWNLKKSNGINRNSKELRCK